MVQKIKDTCKYSVDSLTDKCFCSSSPANKMSKIIEYA